MDDALGRWRLSYLPGEWVVLCGPTSLVVLQPASADLSELISTLWLEVVGSSSLVDLAARFAAHGMQQMPSFAALFWSGDGMRSLVRGEVVLTDAATGAVVAQGRGVQTWTEGGLESVERVEITMGANAGSAGDGLRLPLVVGAVRASSLTLDASPAARLSSPQGSAEQSVPDHTSMEDGDTVLMSGQDGAPDLVATERLHHGESVLARLVVSDGTVVELDRPVRIGRAPSSEPSSSDGPHLVTVDSPSHDISRTHVEVAPVDGGIVVTDLHSTNGTLLFLVGQAEGTTMTPGVATPATIGSALDLGDGVIVLIEPPQ